MKFCSKCGKEIHEDAVVCVHCGCSVENTPKATSHSRMLETYKSNVSTIFTLSIVGIVLSFGIGFIFAIISYVKYFEWKNLTNIDNLNDYERIEFEEARKRLKTSEWLNGITLSIFIIMIAGIFVMTLAGM